MGLPDDASRNDVVDLELAPRNMPIRVDLERLAARQIYRNESCLACVGSSVYMVGLLFAFLLVFLEIRRLYYDRLVSG